MPENKSVCPQHIAVIMDGNGRWGRKRGYSRSYGHMNGLKAVRRLLNCVLKQSKTKYLTIFACGQDNRQRPQDEVAFLDALFGKVLRRSQWVRWLVQQQVKVEVIGDRTALSPSLQKDIQCLERRTATHKRLVLRVAYNYSGHWEIFHAVTQRVEQLSASMTQDQFIALMQQQTVPAPDLLIRTGGAQRLSNFLLWDMVYAELYFTNTLWPDFGQQVFDEAMIFYTKAQRKFGLLQEESA